MSDNQSGFIVQVEEETRIECKRLRVGKLCKVVVIDVIFILIIDGAEQSVTGSFKLSGIEDREVSAERGGLIENDRRDRCFFRLFADEVDYTGDCSAAVERCRRSFDYLDLF